MLASVPQSVFAPLLETDAWMCTILPAPVPAAGKASLQRSAQGLGEGGGGGQTEGGTGWGEQAQQTSHWGWIQDPALGQIITPSPGSVSPMQAAWFCASVLAGTDPNRPQG